MKKSILALLAIITVSFYSCTVKPPQGTKKRNDKGGTSKILLPIDKTPNSTLQTIG